MSWKIVTHNSMEGMYFFQKTCVPNLVDLEEFFSPKNPGDLKNLPFKMVADSDGLLVQPTSEHRNFESKTFQKEVSSSNDSFSGVNYVSLPECSP